MKQSQYNSYDDLPLFLNADIVAKVLGVRQCQGVEESPPRPPQRHRRRYEYPAPGLPLVCCLP